MFDTKKDFQYLLQHPNAAEVIARILANAKPVDVDSMHYNAAYPEMCMYDSGSYVFLFYIGPTTYRYCIRHQEDKHFDDFADAVAYILSRWW